MKKTLFFLVFAIIGLIVFSCTSKGNTPLTDKPIDIREKISRACFEVVVKKPVKDSLTYEKELPWNLINFNYRNDDYASIGTAFAISDRELLTAAHVLHLMDDSISYSDFFVRDKNGKVYEIDRLLSYHNARDFVKFTVKNKSFTSWFTLRKTSEINESIFAVGNIYGQGLVAAPGTLLGSIPESEGGQWLYLKSSPPNDKGSSGGPLLDSNGNVIGLIVAKDNNFSYSLPVEEIENHPKNLGIFHKPFIYRFDLFPESTDSIDFDFNVKLPRPYKEVKQYIHLAFKEHYQQNMQKLFDDNGSEIFPKGKSSLRALNTSSSNYTMQVLFKDKDDRNWYFSNLKKETSALERNGVIKYAKINSTFYIDIEKPDDISSEELYSSPRQIMDLILSGISMPRQFANQKIRILSFGEPFQEDLYQDSYGRKWFVYQWMIEYSNEVGLMLFTPTPDGLVCLLKFTRYSHRDIWLVDLKRILDLVYIPYYGSLEEWVEFLKLKKYLYGSLLDLEINYKENNSVYLNIDDLKVKFKENLVEIESKSKLGLLYDFYPDEGKIVWGLREVYYQENEKDNYFVLYRHIRPHDDLPDSYKETWENIVQKGHPYNGVPYLKDGRTNIGQTLSEREKADYNPTIGSQFAFSLYIGKEGSIKEENMKGDLKELADGVQIISPSRLADFK